MYILNDEYDTKKLPFCWLQLVVETFRHSPYRSKINQNSLQVPKVVIKLYYKTLGASGINSPIFPPSLVKFAHGLKNN